MPKFRVIDMLDEDNEFDTTDEREADSLVEVMAELLEGFDIRVEEVKE